MVIHRRWGILSLICLLLITFPLEAKSDPVRFGISSYIPEYFKDLEWRLDGGLSSRASDGETEYTDENRSTESSSYGGNARSYTRWRYRTIPRFYDVRFSLGIDYSNSDSETLRELSRTTSTYVLTDNRWYETNANSWSASNDVNVDAGIYTLADLFLLGSVDLSLHYRETPELGGLDSTFRSTLSLGMVTDRVYVSHREESEVRKNFDGVFELGPGWGRVYEGRFAYTAISMIDQLRDKGVLTREPSKDEMLLLTEIIYQNRQVHAVDSRLRRIQSLGDILDFLADEGLMSDVGSYGSILVQDVWDYYPDALRQFGWQITAGVGHRYSYSKSDESREGYSRQFDTRYLQSDPADVDTLADYVTNQDARDLYRDKLSLSYLFGRFEWFHPISTHWQFDMSLTGRHFFESWVESYRRQEVYANPASGGFSLQRSDDREYYDIDLRSAVYYFLDSRTDLSVSGSVIYEHRNERSWTHNRSSGGPEDWDVTPEREYRNWQSSIYASGRYRISIPTTLRLSLLASSGDSRNISSRTIDRGDWNYQLSLSVQHYLF